MLAFLLHDKIYISYTRYFDKKTLIDKLLNRRKIKKSRLNSTREKEKDREIERKKTNDFFRRKPLLKSNHTYEEDNNTIY